MTKEKILEIVQWGETGVELIDLSDCINLTKIASPSENSFKNITDFSETFAGTGLTSIPEDLFSNCPNVTDFSFAFSYTPIESIPEDLFINCYNATKFHGTFAATSIESIPENLFINCKNETDFSNTFRECKRLTSLPQNLFNNCLHSYFSYTFQNCTNLTGNAIPLWENIEGWENLDKDSASGWDETVPSGEGCYNGCTKLNGYDDNNIIPYYWKMIRYIS